MPKSPSCDTVRASQCPSVLLAPGLKLMCSPNSHQYVGISLVAVAVSCPWAALLLKQQSTWGQDRTQTEEVRVVFSACFQALMIKANVGTVPSLALA